MQQREEFCFFLTLLNRCRDQTGQRTNTAISVKARRENFKALKEHLNSTDENIAGWVQQLEIILLFILRVVIQLANLICAIILGELYFGKKHSERTEPEKKEVKVVNKWKAKYTQEEKVGFVGIVELSDGTFRACLPDQRRNYKSFNRALKFFEGTPYEGKVQ